MEANLPIRKNALIRHKIQTYNKGDSQTSCLYNSSQALAIRIREFFTEKNLETTVEVSSETLRKFVL